MGNDAFILSLCILSLHVGPLGALFSLAPSLLKKFLTPSITACLMASVYTGMPGSLLVFSTLTPLFPEASPTTLVGSGMRELGKEEVSGGWCPAAGVLAAGGATEASGMVVG